MNIIKQSKNSFKKELLCWSGLLVYLILFDFVKGSLAAKSLFIVLYFSNFALAYYILYLFLFPNFFEHKKLKFILGYLLVIINFLVIDFTNVKIIIPYLGGHLDREKLELYPFLRRSMLQFCFVAFASTGSFLSWRNINHLKERAEREKNLMAKELLFLKNQFDSHLTFNFLNFCYSETMIYSSDAAKAIEEFSKMLYSALNNELSSYIPLKNEIEHIQQFISVQRCLTSKIFIEVDINGDLSRYTILSRILSIFVENTFRHGIFNEKENPIVIKLTIKNDDLTFFVKNKKSNNTILQTEGLGLRNLKQLLDLFYQKNYHLEIDQNDSFYSSTLNLKLLPIHEDSQTKEY
jgi:hypothetical protein